MALEIRGRAPAAGVELFKVDLEFVAVAGIAILHPYPSLWQPPLLVSCFGAPDVFTIILIFLFICFLLTFPPSSCHMKIA